MAENLETKSKKQDNPTKKVENFMIRNRKPILIVGICIVAVAAAVGTTYLNIMESNLKILEQALK